MIRCRSHPMYRLDFRYGHEGARHWVRMHDFTSVQIVSIRGYEIAHDYQWGNVDMRLAEKGTPGVSF